MPGKGARQTACQVIVDKDSLELIAGKGTIWDSGKKDSEQILITYSGQETPSFYQVLLESECMG